MISLFLFTIASTRLILYGKPLVVQKSPEKLVVSREQ